MTEYNGHRNRNHWNVSLWIFSDEGLYQLAHECYKRTRNLRNATRQFIYCVGTSHTPYGAPYTYSSVYQTMRAIKGEVS